MDTPSKPYRPIHDLRVFWIRDNYQKNLEDRGPAADCNKVEGPRSSGMS